MQPAKLFFYFNGFNSAILDDFSGSAKISAVAGYAESRDFSFRPVSINFRQARSHCHDILDQIGPEAGHVVFCGSSMGGWFARIMQLLVAAGRPDLPIHAIAFNPAFDLTEHGHMLLGPQVNYVTFEKYEWTQQHSDQLGLLERSVDYDASLPFFVYVDKGDETIGWEYSAQRHRNISEFRAFDGGCHSFDHFMDALRDFDEKSSNCV